MVCQINNKYKLLEKNYVFSLLAFLMVYYAIIIPVLHCTQLSAYLLLCTKLAGTLQWCCNVKVPISMSTLAKKADD
jgi:hypothetical protein